MTRLRATFTVEYDADPDYYGTDDPEKMAQVDYENFMDDPGLVAETVTNIADEWGIQIKVTPVE